MFSTIPKANFNFSFTLILLSANAFNLDQSYPFPKQAWFLRDYSTSLLKNTVGKG